LFGHGSQNGIHIFLKAHIEHFIRFVEHYPTQAGVIDFSATHHILQTAWCGHNNLRIAVQFFDLGFDACPAINCSDAYIRHKHSKTREVFCDLQTEFACWTQYECLCLFQTGIEVVQNRQAKGCSFACSGLG